MSSSNPQTKKLTDAPEYQAVVEAAKGPNVAAMFASYASGNTLEEVAEIFMVPVPAVKRLATKQGWFELTRRVPAVPPASGDQARLAALEANRKANFELAAALRERLAHDFAALRAGTLRVERAMVCSGQIVHTEVEPGPTDMVAMANAAKAMAEITYRALGDHEALGGGGPAGKGGSASTGNNDVNSITVILPTVVHQPSDPVAQAKPVAASAHTLQTGDIIDLRTPEGPTKASVRLLDDVLTGRESQDDGPPEFHTKA